MTTPFAFVPRTVQKYTKEWQGISRPSPSPSPSPTDEDESGSDDHDDDKAKEKVVGPVNSKQSTITQDLASLISLALADYNIWFDSELRWKLDTCLQDGVSPDDAGFVPINYLIRRPPFRGALPLTSGHPEPSESDVVKALRAHAIRILDVRMRLPLSSTSTSAASVWCGTGKTSRKKDVGGYEVRRRDWATLRHHPSREWTQARWDAVTAYMECIPPQYRTIGGITRFAESLLLEADAKAEVETDRVHFRIQCVTLPSHYLDKPGDVPRCKGYALVTFSTKSGLDAVLRAWPWQRRIPSPANENTPTIVKEARKYGLRAISKARWDALNEEYLIYKQSLMDEMARTEAETQHAPDDEHDESTALPAKVEPQAEMEVRTTRLSPYPFDCLVFVRNVHPNTNKTMLKSLFGRAFEDHDISGPERGPGRAATGLDYVDFNKGMDTCHLRLASPSHTTRLLAYFTAHPTAQAHGLDETGRAPLADDKPIAVERVQGRKEEVYWEGIPDKVRKQAVERVVQMQPTGTESVTPSAGQRDGASGSRRKKRTRE